MTRQQPLCDDHLEDPNAVLSQIAELARRARDEDAHRALFSERAAPTAPRTIDELYQYALDFEDRLRRAEPPTMPATSSADSELGAGERAGEDLIERALAGEQIPRAEVVMLARWVGVIRQQARHANGRAAEFEAWLAQLEHPSALAAWAELEAALTSYQHVMRELNAGRAPAVASAT